MKETVIKPNYYDSFKCAGSDCIHTCCRAWEIEIDDETFKKYRDVKGKLGEKIKKNIFASRKIISFNKGVCPFLTEDNLCEIQQKLGADSLCFICKVYPRNKREFFYITRYDLLLSCPEVIKIVLESKKLFNKEEIKEILENNNQPDFNEKEMIFCHQKIFKTILIQIEKEKDFNRGLYLLTSFFSQIQTLLDEKDCNEKLKNSLNKYDENFFKKLKKTFNSNPNPDFVLTFFKQIHDFLIETNISGITDNAIFDIKSLKEIPFKNCIKNFKRFIVISQKKFNWKRIFYYLIKFYMFDTYWILNLKELSNLILYFYVFCMYLWFVHFCINNYLSKNNQKIILANLFRKVEHSFSFKKAKDIFENQKIFDSDNLKKFLETL